MFVQCFRAWGLGIRAWAWGHREYLEEALGYSIIYCNEI